MRFSVHKQFQTYLKFRWQGILYQYTCIPFGLCIAPWLYTKLNKPIVAYLRSKGLLLVSYLDDTLLFGKTSEECLGNIYKTSKLFKKLGLVINIKKSQLVPSQTVQFLGFEVSSKTMELFLPLDKREKLLAKCIQISKTTEPLLLDVAKLIGSLIAAAPASKYGMLYTRQLEIEKTEALIRTGGKYVGWMTLSSVAIRDIEWWVQHINSQSSSMKPFLPHIEMYTDASQIGWGADGLLFILMFKNF